MPESYPAAGKAAFISDGSTPCGCKSGICPKRGYALIEKKEKSGYFPLLN
jgi:hypothetical protein